MPYRARGRSVMVKKGGRWRLKKRMKSAMAARKHAQALNINVHRKGRR